MCTGYSSAPRVSRAGWGVLLFVLLFIGFSFLSLQVLKHFSPQSPFSSVSLEIGIHFRIRATGAPAVDDSDHGSDRASASPGIRISRQSESGALHFRLGLGIRRPFRFGACFVEGRAACLRRSTVTRRRRLERRPGLGRTIPGSRCLRRINPAGLSAIHADAGHWILVGCAGAFVPVWLFPRHQPR